MTAVATDPAVETGQQKPPARPWGLSRATRPLPPVALPWTSVTLDAQTQLAEYRDADGRPLDITCETYPTVTTSRPHDGSSGASPVADDSNTDQKS